jgi:hypothetical protein
MNIAYIVINDLSELDFDDLYERSKDAIDASWPKTSSLTDAERKAAMIAIIQSGIDNEWPGLNPHGPHDRYTMVKMVDVATGKEMGFISGYVLSDGTMDGRHSLVAPDDNGSRNYLYSAENRPARDGYLTEIGVNKGLFRNITANSVFHKVLRSRANSGAFEIIEDVDSPALGPLFRNVKVLYDI